LALWLGVLVLMYSVGGAIYLVDGRDVPVVSWRWLKHAMPFSGSLTVGTMVALHWVPRLVVRPSAEFWRGCATLVLVLSLAHATVNILFEGMAEPLRWIVMAVPLYGFHYSAIVGVVAVSSQRRLNAARQRELLAVQLRALRAQLQPHFLFNTLQAIGATAPRDGAAAAHMTALLGDLLRQTLQERDGGFVSLAEEHELLRPYVELQQLRFGDRLQFELDLPSALLGARIPDLLLQPLVENALQHGIEQRPGAGRVRVSARREGEQLVLDVADDGAGPGSDCQEPKSGTGLGATRSRLQTLFGSRASLALQKNGFGGCTATLRLPYDEAAHAA
jgi:signal transduction histidine kinase